jgi:hypothetical protein
MKIMPNFGAAYIKTGKSPIASGAIAISALTLNLFYPGEGFPISMMCRRLTVSFAFFSQKAKRLLIYEGAASVIGRLTKQPE